MKHLIRNTLVALLSVGLAGCEWSGSGDDNSWNDSGTIANFNGSYHANGGYLVSDYTASGGTTTTTTGGKTVIGENKGTSSGGTSFAGSTQFFPIKPGSFRLLLNAGATGQFIDDGASKLSGQYLNGVNFNAHGSISYDNGTYTIVTDTPVPLPSGSTITVNYTVEGGSSTSSTTTSGEPGSSGVSIIAFNVQQSGNKIKIVDNNGSVYQGNLGEMRTTGNLGSGSTGATFVNGDQVIASFSAAGKSKSGMYVNMTGNFQGEVQGVSTVTTKAGDVAVTTTSMALANRRIMGTWIEDGGKTGNISGISDSAVNVSASSSVTNVLTAR